MNTPTITTALPAAPNHASNRATGASPEPEASSSSFSSILTRQQTQEAAPKAAPAIAPESPKKASGELVSDGAESTDEVLAEQATEQGLTLPQIALNIAAEVALAMAARKPGAAPVGTATGDVSLMSTARANRILANPEATADALVAGNAPARAILATTDAALSASGNATSKAATAIKLDPQAITGNKAIELPAGFVPAQATALPHQTELDLRKAPGTAGMRKNSLAGQALPTDLAVGKTAASSTTLNVDVASVISKVSFASASMPTDLSASQAGSITAAGTAASTNMLSGSMGSAINTGAQPALPGIATPLQSPHWGADFGRQFVSLTQGGHNMPHTAELRLDPPELGPLRISINISDNVAHAVFTSAHAAVRQTVENSLPQLQQLLAQAGISLGQTSVNDQGQTDQSFSESFGSSGKTAASGNGAIGDAPSTAKDTTARSQASNALVDTFA